MSTLTISSPCPCHLSRCSTDRLVSQIPDVLKHRQIDHWVKVDDPEAFAHARRLIKNGLLCGGSCGSALAGALAFLRSDEGKHIAQDPKANVVILLADSCVSLLSS